MSLVRRVRPESLAGSGLTRAMLLARSRQVRSGSPAERALGRSLVTTALGRSGAEEREWIGRIQARRAEVATLGADAYADPAAGDADEVADFLAASAEPWSVPKIWGRLMMRMVRELRPSACLELGTGFGISGLYVGAALRLNGDGRLRTIDNTTQLRPVAEGGFAALGLADVVELVTGDIEETLESALAGIGRVEWALVDAEHTENATVAHFEALVPGLAPDAVVLVDDINLSPDMQRAWERIASHAAVTTAIDLHRLGVVVAG